MRVLVCVLGGKELGERTKTRIFDPTIRIYCNACVSISAILQVPFKSIANGAYFLLVIM